MDYKKLLPTPYTTYCLVVKGIAHLTIYRKLLTEKTELAAPMRF